MKRKVLCVFSLLLILLVFCTLVSPKAEEEMCLLADARKINGARKSGRNASVSNIAITWERSSNVLFNIVEGDGWESGLRVAEIPAIYYDNHGEYLSLGAGTDYWYIYSASREPVAGGSVTPVEKTWKDDDTYLLLVPNVADDLDFLRSYAMTELQRSENAVLVDVRQGTFPFFEHTVWYSLKKWMGDDLRVYSIHDVTQFLEAVPWLSAVAAVLLCSLLLWGASWLPKADRRKGILWLNGLLTAGLLAALPCLLGQFDLPASLMPQESILDISHYLETFERIFAALEAMGSPILDEAVSRAATGSALVMGISLLAAAGIIGVELHLLAGKKE